VSRRGLFKECSAEFAGTMILILFGSGVVAQVVTLPDGAGGDHDSIAWAWGIGVTLGVYTAARISGGHLNPAVTVASAVFKGFEWRKVLPYSLAQLAGAFVAAAIVRVAYDDLITGFDRDTGYASQGIFSTSPSEGVTMLTAFADQIIGTAILVFVVFALTHARNNPPLSNLGPVLVGLVVVAIGMAWGANAGYAINPARDLGPRLAQWMTGYANAFRSTTGDHPIYFWVPIVAPLLGGIVGGGAFHVLVGRHLDAEEDDEADGAVPDGLDPSPEREAELA